MGLSFTDSDKIDQTDLYARGALPSGGLEWLDPVLTGSIRGRKKPTTFLLVWAGQISN